MGTESACDAGEHRLEWDGRAGETVCSRCGYTAAAIVNDLHQRLYAAGTTTYSRPKPELEPKSDRPKPEPEPDTPRDTELSDDVADAITGCERVGSP
ncbi:hypothetical protein [Natronosalvus vescus]|uniref:hypothetical protein n=1 Tax=Natronosalvus vescus TaxID=2953881 RepID=UPI0020910488|nr:hypothetical protein [Natronosalvus vescus]